MGTLRAFDPCVRQRIAISVSVLLAIKSSSPRQGSGQSSQVGVVLVRLKGVTAGIVGVALSFLVTVASAGPKEDVAAATLKWAQALGEDDPDKVLSFYSDDAVLWGTLSPTVRADRAALRDYFVTAFKVLPGLKVAFGDQLIRVYDSTAVNTGYYTFSFVKDGETKSLPARYSFTYVKRGDDWLIVDHHSSAMPSPPK